MRKQSNPTRAKLFRLSPAMLVLLTMSCALLFQFRGCGPILTPSWIFGRGSRAYAIQFAVAEFSSRTIASFFNLLGGPAFPWGPLGEGTRAVRPDLRYALSFDNYEMAVQEDEQFGLPKQQAAPGSPIYFVGAPADSVTVLNSETAAQLALIPVGTDPRWIEIHLGSGKAYVSNRGSDSVSEIDLVSMAVERTLPLAEGSAPIGVAPGPDGQRLYVVNTGLNSLSAVDLMSGQIVATAAAGAGALHVAVSPDGQLAYVTNQTAGSVSVFDTTSMELVTTIEGLDGAMSVAFEDRGRKAYVTAGSFSSGQVHVINTSDHSIVGSIRVGANPVSIRLGPYGNFLFVANQAAGSISIVDVETETVTQTVPVGAQPSDVAPIL